MEATLLLNENNLLNIGNQDDLLKAINVFSLMRISQLSNIKLPVNININLLKSIHKFIFGDIFSWAGEIKNKNIEKKAENEIEKANSIEWKNQNINEAARKLSEILFNLELMKIFDIGYHQAIMLFTETLCKDKEIIIDIDYLRSRSVAIEKETEIDLSVARENVYEIIKEAMLIGFVKENTYENIATIISKEGYQPEDTLIKLIKKLNETRLKMHTVIEIYDLYKYPEKLGDMEKKYVMDIADGFRTQERIYLYPSYKIKEPEYTKEL